MYGACHDVLVFPDSYHSDPDPSSTGSIYRGGQSHPLSCASPRNLASFGLVTFCRPLTRESGARFQFARDMAHVASHGSAERIFNPGCMEIVLSGWRSTPEMLHAASILGLCRYSLNRTNELNRLFHAPINQDILYTMLSKLRCRFFWLFSIIPKPPRQNSKDKSSFQWYQKRRPVALDVDLEREVDVRHTLVDVTRRHNVDI